MRRLNLDQHRYCAQPDCGDEPDPIDPRIAILLLRGLCALHQRMRQRAVQHRLDDLDRAENLTDDVRPLAPAEIDAFLNLIPNDRDMSNPHAVVWANYQRLTTQLRMAADAIRDTIADTQDSDEPEPAGADQEAA